MAAKDTAFTIVGEFGWPKFWADRIRLGKQAFGKTAFWKTEFWARILGRFSVRPAQAGQSQRWPTSACLEQVWPAKAGQSKCWPNLACLGQVWPARDKFGQPRCTECRVLSRSRRVASHMMHVNFPIFVVTYFSAGGDSRHFGLESHPRFRT